jgi:thiol peroxidase
VAKIKLKETVINTIGDLPPVGQDAPDFNLTKSDMSDITLTQYKGRKVVLNIFPSIDTPVCATSVRRFNTEINNHKNAVVICVSLDLPFAHTRFCGAEGLENIISASELRSREFGNRYGVRIIDGPLAGLLARAVVVIDETGKVIYTQLVPEISEEPNYNNALKALS